jgi:hypothetical protein
MKNDKLITKLIKAKRWDVRPDEGEVYSWAGKRLGRWGEHNGYFRIETTVEGKKCRLAVHRIIWIFVHGCPRYGTLINHKDCNTRHNCVGNLEKSSHSHNTKHAWGMKCRTADNNHAHRVNGKFARREADAP